MRIHRLLQEKYINYSIKQEYNRIKQEYNHIKQEYNHYLYVFVVWR